MSGVVESFRTVFINLSLLCAVRSTMLQIWHLSDSQRMSSSMIMCVFIDSVRSETTQLFLSTLVDKLATLDVPIANISCDGVSHAVVVRGLERPVIVSEVWRTCSARANSWKSKSVEKSSVHGQRREDLDQEFLKYATLFLLRQRSEPGLLRGAPSSINHYDCPQFDEELFQTDEFCAFASIAIDTLKTTSPTWNEERLNIMAMVVAHLNVRGKTLKMLSSTKMAWLTLPYLDDALYTYLDTGVDFYRHVFVPERNPSMPHIVLTRNIDPDHVLNRFVTHMSTGWATFFNSNRGKCSARRTQMYLEAGGTLHATSKTFQMLDYSFPKKSVLHRRNSVMSWKLTCVTCGATSLLCSTSLESVTWLVWSTSRPFWHGWIQSQNPGCIQNPWGRISLKLVTSAHRPVQSS
ncbi:hypothetical protein AaE_015652 [Aphanomyces astaci]|uniref:Uncharacterized protein n=1 Tax=Aphanomyces astaci TaxID=112090 RepID=A0A6A4YWJ1_APHAT|nr:hypothetical protein AaE_015652 [Aphanomyces astaci]